MNPDALHRPLWPPAAATPLRHHAAMLRVLRHRHLLGCVLPDADPRPAAAPAASTRVPRAA